MGHDGTDQNPYRGVEREPIHSSPYPVVLQANHQFAVVVPVRLKPIDRTRAPASLAALDPLGIIV